MEIRQAPVIAKKVASYVYKTAFTEQGRIDWMENRIRSGLDKGFIDPKDSEVLFQQAREKGMQRHIFDCTVGWALIEASQAGAYFSAWNLSEGNPLVVGAIFASPISPNGIIRALYSAGRMTEEVIRMRSFKPVRNRAIGITIAPVKWLGTTSFAVQMGGSYPEMSQFMFAMNLESSTSKVKRIPVIGEPIAKRIHQTGALVINNQEGQEIRNRWLERLDQDELMPYHFYPAY